MALLANIKIDVTKIDKSRLFQGKKGTYLDLIIAINDEKDNYDNDVSAWESQTKEERENKNQKNYLGNGKVFWTSEKEARKEPETSNQNDEKDDGLPF